MDRIFVVFIYFVIIIIIIIIIKISVTGITAKSIAETEGVRVFYVFKYRISDKYDVTKYFHMDIRKNEKTLRRNWLS